MKLIYIASGIYTVGILLVFFGAFAKFQNWAIAEPILIAGLVTEVLAVGVTVYYVVKVMRTVKNKKL